MTIAPKYNIGRNQRRNIAMKQFTDREFVREVFAKYIEKLKRNTIQDKNNYHVIVYYGVGGIGKSSLQKQLMKELIENNDNVLYTYVDFIDPIFHSPSRALLELVKNIKYPKKITFPHFDVAYSIYFSKKNPDFVFNEKKLPFEDEANIIGNILSNIDGFGIAGAVTGIVSKIYKKFTRIGLQKEAKESLMELENINAKDIEERLPAFFAYDLKIAIEKNKISVVTFFLDTYEALFSNNKNEETKYYTDAWVRELISQLPGVLFVICGRDRIDWEKYDPDWKNYLDQHLLDCLSEKDAELFLIQCGIAEKEIRDKIILSSLGHPYHLDLSVDTYFEIKNKGEIPTVDKFGSNKREILDRFLKYLDDTVIEMLKLITIPRFYDEEIFRFLLNNFQTGYPITKLNDFNKFSFVSSDNNGKFFIHDLMRKELLNYIDASMIREVNRLMASFYDEKLDRINHILIHDEYKLFLLENIYHYKNCLEKDKFITWLYEKRLKEIKDFQSKGETAFLKDLLLDIYNYVGDDKLFGTELFNILVDMVHLSGEYKKAVLMIDNYLDSYNMDEIIESQGLLNLFIRRIHHKMFYCPISPLIKELLDLEKIIDKNRFPYQYNEILFMIGGNLGVLSGDYEFSRGWLYKSIKFALENNFTDYLCRSLRKYADVLKSRNHCKFAEKICDIGIKISKDNNFDRYELYLQCTKADILRNMGKYKQAIEIYSYALAISKKLGINGWKANIFLGLAEAYLDVNKTEDAEIYLNNAENIYKKLGHEWGMLQVIINRERCKLIKGLKISEEIIHSAINKANDLGYLEEYRFLNEMLRGKKSHKKLMFL